MEETRYCAEIIRGERTEYVRNVLRVGFEGNLMVLQGADFETYVAMNGEITVTLTEQDT